MVETTSKKIKFIPDKPIPEKIISTIEAKSGKSQRPETPQPKSHKKAQKN